VTRAYFIFVLAASLARADSLEEVLKRMDQAALKFRSLTAHVHHTDYTDVLSDLQEEEGTFKMMKHAKTGVVLLAEFTGKDSRKVWMSGNTVKIYYPKANEVDIFDTRKFTKSADLLLLVGFGETRADLEKMYNISLGGNETVGTAKATRIDLKPKSAEAKKLFNVIQLWIPDGGANPIQEKVLSGKDSKDYKLFTFSDEIIRTNADPPLPASDFELNLKPGVKTITPGK
jgi:outer membrane lipoprotein-sorting protein